ncbi:enoyl-CoA hydratase/isomerase family protein [Microbacterium sp. KHB019]|uniref:enoyl-CoA hydratase/isomerase family protein n=1 Tax=Microbacterium sp. KHB019 TaxID=3129770 RepID=UPI003078B7EB
MTDIDVELTVDRRDDGIVVATLNRPDKLNALTDGLFRDLARLQAELAEDSSVRALILTGAGRGFCAGLDLDLAERLPGMTAVDFLATQERWAASIVGFHRLSVPVIAAISGPAAGAGFALALAADIRIVSRSARFNAAFVRVGLSAGDCGASWFLPRIVGHGRAAEILLTGRFVPSDEALAIGLVSDVVDDGAQLDRAIEVAAAIRANSPFGMRMTKQILASAPTSLEAALAVENRTQVLATRTSDMAEAVSAFREKRTPRFENA